MHAPLRGSLLSLLLLSALLSSNAVVGETTAPASLAATSSFVSSIDTMKESRDSLNNPLTDAQIMEDVTTTASLGARYVTVDVPYDYPNYMSRWVNAARTAGLRVWFRSTFDAWEGIYTATATMTPADYTAALSRFIIAHPNLYRLGDILDPLPEPENGPYWARVSPYGSSWTWLDAPNATTDEYNKFFVDLSHAADTALTSAGVAGVSTTIRSTNGYIAARPSILYPSTVATMGRVTTDSYVGQSPTITPALALQDIQREIGGIESARRVPLVIGEIGYSTEGLVDDQQQQMALRPQLDWLRTLPYLQGVNYWHGAGYPAPDTWNGAGLFKGTTGAWTPRSAGLDLAAFFSAKTQSWVTDAITPSTGEAALTNGAPAPSLSPTPTTMSTDTPTTTSTPTPAPSATETPTPTETPIPAGLPTGASANMTAASPTAINTRAEVTIVAATNTPRPPDTRAPTMPLSTATAPTRTTSTAVPLASATAPGVPTLSPPTATALIILVTTPGATDTAHPTSAGSTPTATAIAPPLSPARGTFPPLPATPAPTATATPSDPASPMGTATPSSVPYRMSATALATAATPAPTPRGIAMSPRAASPTSTPTRGATHGARATSTPAATAPTLRPTATPPRHGRRYTSAHQRATMGRYTSAHQRATMAGKPRQKGEDVVGPLAGRVRPAVKAGTRYHSP